MSEVQQEYRFAKFSKPKKKDKSVSAKINFYRKPEELPEVIDAKDFRCFVAKKKKNRLGRSTKKFEYNNSRYDSTWEVKIAKELDVLLGAKEIAGWEKQRTIQINLKVIDNQPILTDETMHDLKKLGIQAYHICSYRIDFVVKNLDETQEFIEVKGFRTEIFNLKWKLFSSLYMTIHPQHKLRIVN